MNEATAEIQCQSARVSHAKAQGSSLVGAGVRPAPIATVHGHCIAPDGRILCALLRCLGQQECAVSIAGEALEVRQVEQAARTCVFVPPRVRMLCPHPQHAVSAVQVAAGGCENRGRTPQQHVLGLGWQELVPEQLGKCRYRLLVRTGGFGSQSDGTLHGGGVGGGGSLQRGCQCGCVEFGCEEYSGVHGLCTEPPPPPGQPGDRAAHKPATSGRAPASLPHHDTSQHGGPGGWWAQVVATGGGQVW